jgi:hypothetical protein
MYPLGSIISLLILSLQSASQEAPGAATTAPSTDTTAAAPSTETEILIPISQYTFSAFPLPSQTAVAGVSPLSDPRDPPPIGSSLIPDFAHAWAGAYQEAKNKVSAGVSRFVRGLGPSLFNNLVASCLDRKFHSGRKGQYQYGCWLDGRALRRKCWRILPLHFWTRITGQHSSNRCKWLQIPWSMPRGPYNVPSAILS